MKKDKREGAFIPCGDSMEKMEEIKETDLENVSGGAGYFPATRVCPNCGNTMRAQCRMQNGASVLDHYYCSSCGHEAF